MNGSNGSSERRLMNGDGGFNAGGWHPLGHMGNGSGTGQVKGDGVGMVSGSPKHVFRVNSCFLSLERYSPSALLGRDGG